MFSQFISCKKKMNDISVVKTLVLLGVLLVALFLYPEASKCYAATDVEDGNYTVEVEMSGGSGRASITSPAEVVVEDGKGFAYIQWSSSHYDYMIVEGEKYLPVNEEGNSMFYVPVKAWNEPLTMIADTTAMSVPHEVEYEITFHMEEKGNSYVVLWVVIAMVTALVIGIFIGVTMVVKKKPRTEEKVAVTDDIEQQ